MGLAWSCQGGEAELAPALCSQLQHDWNWQGSLVHGRLLRLRAPAECSDLHKSMKFKFSHVYNQAALPVKALKKFPCDEVSLKETTASASAHFLAEWCIFQDSLLH